MQTFLFIIILGVGILDELKLFPQWKKIRNTNKFSSLSKRTFIISVFSKFIVFIYSLIQHLWLFSILYCFGLVSSFLVIMEIYKRCNIKNKTVKKFILKSFHLKGGIK